VPPVSPVAPMNRAPDCAGCCWSGQVFLHFREPDTSAGSIGRSAGFIFDRRRLAYQAMSKPGVTLPPGSPRAVPETARAASRMYSSVNQPWQHDCNNALRFLDVDVIAGH